MNFIYVVTWIIISISPTSCPDRPIKNEFGIYSGMVTGCAVLHIKTEQTPMRKEFTNRDSAFAFYERAIGESGTQKFYYLGSHVSNVAIDSIEVEIEVEE